MGKKPFRQTMVTAIHEAGHAVARFALDEGGAYRGPRLRYVTAVPGRVKNTLGHLAQDANTRIAHWPSLKDVGRSFTCSEADRAKVVESAARGAQRDIVETLAGPYAEWHRGSAMGATLTLRRVLDGILELPEDTEPGCDFSSIACRLRWLGPADPASELRFLAAVAQAMVVAEWPGIRAVAPALFTAGTMDGEVFEAGWRRLRPDAATRVRRWEEWRRDWRDSGPVALLDARGVTYHGGVLVGPFSVGRQRAVAAA